MSRIFRRIVWWVICRFVNEKRMIAYLNDAPRRGKFVCRCWRKQKYAAEGEKGGITEKEAEWLGWRKIDGWWTCPICTGNVDNLMGIWRK